MRLTYEDWSISSTSDIHKSKAKSAMQNTTFPTLCRSPKACDTQIFDGDMQEFHNILYYSLSLSITSNFDLPGYFYGPYKLTKVT